MPWADHFLVDGVFTALELCRALIDRVLMGAFAMDDDARVAIFAAGGTFNGGLAAFGLAAFGLASEMTGAPTSSLRKDPPTAAAGSEMDVLISGLEGTGPMADGAGNENGPRGAAVVVVAADSSEERQIHCMAR